MVLPGSEEAQEDLEAPDVRQAVLAKWKRTLPIEFVDLSTEDQAMYSGMWRTQKVVATTASPETTEAYATYEVEAQGLAAKSAAAKEALKSKHVGVDVVVEP